VHGPAPQTESRRGGQAGTRPTRRARRVARGVGRTSAPDARRLPRGYAVAAAFRPSRTPRPRLARKCGPAAGAAARPPAARGEQRGGLGVRARLGAALRAAGQVPLVGQPLVVVVEQAEGVVGGEGALGVARVVGAGLAEVVVARAVARVVRRAVVHAVAPGHASTSAAGVSGA
jgi:hypothetical protein